MNKQPILEVDRFGNKRWYHNGQLHNEDGPAFETVNKSKYWFVDGKLHRVDGPAIIYDDGSKVWSLNDRDLTFDEWFSKLTSEQQYNYLWNIDE
jgi:hypothetical protein